MSLDLVAVAAGEAVVPAVADLAPLNGDPGPDQEAARRRPTAVASGRVENGADFFLDSAAEVPALWSAGDDVAWASGEPLMIVAPPGVGKTTATQQLAFRRHGVLSGPLLGMTVEPSDGVGLYIAADRPSQAARSARRMVDERHRAVLSERMRVWRGPLPFDLGRCERGSLADFLAEVYPEVTDVYIDSLKDVAVKLTDDEVGARVNGELQEVVARGIEVAVDHHQRKASSENKTLRRLDDVYGSTWLTAGCGSVLLLWGQPGDAIVEVRHLKAPSGEVGPLSVLVDHAAGTLEIHGGQQDLLDHARAALGDGLTARSAAVALYGKNQPSTNEIERARAKLKRDDRLEPVEGSSPAAFRPKGGAS